MFEKTLALFDFDGTITSQDTLPLLIRYIKGDFDYLKGVIKMSPTLFKYTIGLENNSTAKEKFLGNFIKGMSLDEFQKGCDDFGLLKLHNVIRKDAMQAVKDHQKKNHRVIVISASCENWISAWCRQTGIEYIGTRLQVIDGKLNGQFSSPNCYGNEKVKRLKELLDIATYSSIYAYGDSGGDKEMLAISHHPHFRPFKN